MNTVRAAAAVIQRHDGLLLMAQRPPGRGWSGWWEFPGGKLEAHETVAQALSRELQEEIGLKIEDVHLWREQLVDYPHALVRLNFCKVTRWQGELEMREGQQFAWQSLPVQVVPVLPGTVPVLAWLAEETGFVGDTHQAAG